MNDLCSVRKQLVLRALLSLLSLLVFEGTTTGVSAQSPADLSESMVVWKEAYRHQMAPVRIHMRRVVLAVHEGRISDLPAVCPGFRSAILALDRDSLLAAADPAVSANVQVALDLLDAAVGKCRRSRYFDLSFQLYKAQYLIEVIDQRLLRYR